MEAIMEPITVTQTISGTDVIDDLCRRIRERLSRSDSLRSVDAYRSYSAKLSIQLELSDIDLVSLREEFVVGTPSYEPQSQRIAPQQIALERQASAKGVIAKSGVEPAPLERCVDATMPVKEKRFYAPRNRPKPRF